jgi:predicted enzyme related to lactoylglutathione lyase
MPDSIVHFEIPVDDRDRAHKFYSEAFGWSINHMPEMQYTLVGTTESNEDGSPTNPGAINGGMADRQGPIEHTVVTIGVDDIDKSLEKIGSLGGSAVGEKMDVGGMGWAAYFKDSEGNVVGLWQTA